MAGSVCTYSKNWVILSRLQFDQDHGLVSKLSDGAMRCCCLRLRVHLLLSPSWGRLKLWWCREWETSARELIRRAGAAGRRRRLSRRKRGQEKGSGVRGAGVERRRGRGGEEGWVRGRGGRRRRSGEKRCRSRKEKTRRRRRRRRSRRGS